MTWPVRSLWAKYGWGGATGEGLSRQRPRMGKSEFLFLADLAEGKPTVCPRLGQYAYWINTLECVMCIVRHIIQMDRPLCVITGVHWYPPIARSSDRPSREDGADHMSSWEQEETIWALYARGSRRGQISPGELVWLVWGREKRCIAL